MKLLVTTGCKVVTLSEVEAKPERDSFFDYAQNDL
jgi:hypothetical protein